MKYFKILLALGLVMFLISFNCSAFKPKKNLLLAQNIKLPAIFSDNMVLQQNTKIPIWGTANPGGWIEVKFNQQKEYARVDSSGKWHLDLGSLSAGGPYQLIITGQDSIINFNNVMVGEVYICSGQSNMEWPMTNVKDAEQEIRQSNYPEIRLFTVQKNTSPVPLTDVTSTGWHPCSPATIANFSAVAYFFGRTLHAHLKIPIGLIHTSWGGTPAEAWTSVNSLKKLPDFADVLKLIEYNTLKKDSLQAIIKEKIDSWEKQLVAWLQYVDQNDPGLAESAPIWNAFDLDQSGWESIQVPGLWENAGIGVLDGSVWFRKEINLPPIWAGRTINLNLGPIDDIDMTWFNGEKVGSGEIYNSPRQYKIPANLVKSGKNVIAIRVLDYGGGGGLWGNPFQLYLKSSAGDSISLAGEWAFKIGMTQPGISFRPDPSAQLTSQPAALFNAMINPLIPYAIRGAIWYQGEANADRAHQYQTLFPALITDWREQWHQADFPFFFVQLANFMQSPTKPVEDAWAELREAQLMTLALPNTGMAVTIDIGEADDIHPKNKQDVGGRLALCALKKVYNTDIEYSGPIYRSLEINGNQIYLNFDHVGNGLETRGSPNLLGFSIAGADKKFYWADAKIVGNLVVIQSPQVPQPVAVRYAWASNPVCNLYNKAGLPASPFRTDNWPGITQ